MDMDVQMTTLQVQQLTQRLDDEIGDERVSVATAVESLEHAVREHLQKLLEENVDEPLIDVRSLRGDKRKRDALIARTMGRFIADYGARLLECCNQPVSAYKVRKRTKSKGRTSGVMLSREAMQPLLKAHVPPVMQQAYEKRRREVHTIDSAAATLLHHYERKNVDDYEALVRVFEAKVEPLSEEHLPELEEMYMQFRLTPLQAKLLAAGKYEELQASVSGGVFLKSFEAYEKYELMRLLKQTQELHDGPQEERYAKERVVGTVLRDPETEELMSVAIYTVPPQNPRRESDPVYLRDQQVVIDRWPDREGRQSFRGDVLSGNVAMLFLILAKPQFRFAPTRALALATPLVRQEAPYVTKVRTYCMDEMKASMDGSVLPDRGHKMGTNTASVSILNLSGFTTDVGVESNDPLSSSAEKFALPDYMDCPEISIAAQWRHFIASIGMLETTTEQKWKKVAEALSAVRSGIVDLDALLCP
jgi:hypothetical protein